MAYYTESQINKAKSIDLLTYLQNYNPNELAHDSRGTYCTKTHDSLKISNGMWYWFSRGIGGKNALEYLIQVENYSFTEAVGHLINQKGIEKHYYQKQELTEKEKIKRLVLPKKASNNDRVLIYLMSRGISSNIINECINKGFIYQEYPNNNVVFVGYDDENNPRFASIRGTNQSRYMHDAYGSDKSYSFKLLSVSSKNHVHLFESAIDLLSYATLKELNNEMWDEENLISLSGIYQPSKNINDSKIPKTLSTFLKKNNNIDTIYLHFDNDNAGRLATEAIKNSLSDSYKIIDDPPKSGKDYNDFLCDLLHIKRQKSLENER